MAQPQEDQEQQEAAQYDAAQAMAHAEATVKETIGDWPDEN